MEPVDDYTQAIALQPSATLFLERGQLLAGHRQYRMALEDFTAAIALAPDSSEAYVERARVYRSLGEFNRELEDLEYALRLRPESLPIAQQRCEALALRGERDKAHLSLNELLAAGADRTWFHWVRGLMLGFDRRYAEAAQEFERAHRAASKGVANLARLAELFAVAARICAQAPRRLPRKAKKRVTRGRIHLCGAGVHPLGSITPEVILALRDCQVVFNNVISERSHEFMRLFCNDCRAVTFRYEQDVERTVQLLMREASAGRIVGYITFGHPLVLGPLARELLERTTAAGMEISVFGGYSSVDAMLAGGAQALPSSPDGYQVLAVTDRSLGLLGQIDPRLPLLLEFPDSRMHQWMEAFLARLRRLYPAGHQGLLFGPHSEDWEAPSRSIPILELGRLDHHLLLQSLLFVPPAATGSVARKATFGIPLQNPKEVSELRVA